MIMSTCATKSDMMMTTQKYTKKKNNIEEISGDGGVYIYLYMNVGKV